MRKNYFKKYVLLFAFILVSAMAFAQTGSIRGTVVDEKNQTLPGASVSVGGTTSGSTTDANGGYVIAGLQPGTYSVSANFIGYVILKKTVTVGTSPVTVNFSLQPQNTSLNEVVVVGYGTQRRSDLTGSVAVVFVQGF